MRYAPVGFVLGSIAYRSGYDRVFRCAVTVQYTASGRCADHCRSGQPGRYRQTNKNTETVKTRSTATSEKTTSSSAGGRAGATRTDCGTGASAATLGKTEAKTEGQGKAEAKTRAKSGIKAARPTHTGGAKAEAKTQEAR